MKIPPMLVLGALASLCLLAPVACDKKEEPKKDAAKADEKKANEKKADEKKADDVKADEPKADGGAAAGDAGGVAADGGTAPADPIGVAECDEYIAKMAKCIEGMDPAAASAAKTGYDAMVNGWRDAAKANPDATAGLATSCKATLDGAAVTNPDCFKAE